MQAQTTTATQPFWATHYTGQEWALRQHFEHAYDEHFQRGSAYEEDLENVNVGQGVS